MCNPRRINGKGISTHESPVTTHLKRTKDEVMIQKNGFSKQGVHKTYAEPSRSNKRNKNI
jgi:hypothetical protein